MVPGTGASPAELIELLGDADPDVRLRAALELGEARHDPAAAAIVERFGHERDFYIRETLTWAALRMPVAALPHVRDALTATRWLSRLQALHTLSKVGDDAAHLAPLIDDPVDAVAARAYWAAAQSRDPRVLPTLVAQLSRGDSEHRNSLTVALGTFGPAAVPTLAEALRAGEPDVRRHAADTLSHMGSPDADAAAPVLAGAVTDPDDGVRLAALNALGQLVLPFAWDVIDEASRAPEPRLRHLAERLLERRPSERTLRLAGLRSERAGSADAAAESSTPAPAAGPWPDPDLSLVTVAGGPQAEELRPRLARQVEVCRPRHLSRADVPPRTLAEVHHRAEAEALAAGRPTPLAARIAVGRVEQYVHETVFLEQVSVTNPGTTVAGMLFGKGVTITWFKGM